MDQPDLILIPFGDEALPGSIDPIPIERGPMDLLQRASWKAGFPDVTMLPEDIGGLPPRGQDVNGVLNAISSHASFVGAGGQYKWSSEWVAEHGGYDKGHVLLSDDGKTSYVSSVDGNSINFNTTPASIGVEWIPFAGERKVTDNRAINAGVGLQGGGSLAADRTLSVVYGTTAGTATQGNDPRVVNAARRDMTQTISGAWTFSQQVILPATDPVSVNAAARRQYVDDRASFQSLYQEVPASQLGVVRHNPSRGVRFVSLRRRTGGAVSGWVEIQIGASVVARMETGRDGPERTPYVFAAIPPGATYILRAGTEGSTSINATGVSIYELST